MIQYRWNEEKQRIEAVLPNGQIVGVWVAPGGDASGLPEGVLPIDPGAQVTAAATAVLSGDPQARVALASGLVNLTAATTPQQPATVATGAAGSGTSTQPLSGQTAGVRFGPDELDAYRNVFTTATDLTDARTKLEQREKALQWAYGRAGLAYPNQPAAGAPLAAESSTANVALDPATLSAYTRFQGAIGAAEVHRRENDLNQIEQTLRQHQAEVEAGRPYQQAGQTRQTAEQNLELAKKLHEQQVTEAGSGHETLRGSAGGDAVGFSNAEKAMGQNIYAPNWERRMESVNPGWLNAWQDLQTAHQREQDALRQFNPGYADWSTQNRRDWWKALDAQDTSLDPEERARRAAESLAPPQHLAVGGFADPVAGAQPPPLAVAPFPGAAGVAPTPAALPGAATLPPAGVGGAPAGAPAGAPGGAAAMGTRTTAGLIPYQPGQLGRGPAPQPGTSGNFGATLGIRRPSGTPLENLPDDERHQQLALQEVTSAYTQQLEGLDQEARLLYQDRERQIGIIQERHAQLQQRVAQAAADYQVEEQRVTQEFAKARADLQASYDQRLAQLNTHRMGDIAQNPFAYSRMPGQPSRMVVPDVPQLPRAA